MLGMQVRIERPDLAIIVTYFVFVVGLGCLAGLRRRGAEGKDYFLAGGTLTWPIIGLALFSTNISTIHLVSQAQVGYLSGLAYGSFEWMAPFTLICLALFFAPFYLRSGVATLPDFLEKRYSRASRNWLALLSIISAIFIHIGFSLYTGAIVLREMFGIQTMTSIIGVSLLTGLYTIVGGLLAVVLTESLQTIILLAGAIAITLIGYGKAGGWAGMAASVDPVCLTVMRTREQLPELPWYAVLLGYPVIGLWYWCADQTIVQRVLGARSENHARVGPLFTGFIKILPMFIFVMPGTIALALIHQGKLPPLAVLKAQDGPKDVRELTHDEQKILAILKDRSERTDVTEKSLRPDELAAQSGLTPEAVSASVSELKKLRLVRDKSEDIYAHMIIHLLPVGLKGIVAAALLAALMSTVSGALNSIATLFCYDIYRQWRPETSDRRLILIGRCVTFVAMLVAIGWTPFIARFENIYRGANSLICYIAPPITVVFIWGVFWRRASAHAAFVTLVVGSLLGLTVFLLEWFREHTGWSVNFMMAAFYLFVICSGVLVTVSLLRPQPADHPGTALVWKHPLEALRGDAWPGIGNYRFLAALLSVTMVVLYVIFR